LEVAGAEWPGSDAPKLWTLRVSARDARIHFIGGRLLALGEVQEVLLISERESKSQAGSGRPAC
jgi:hypothetical protein